MIIVENKGFKEIYFLPNGEKYWIFEGWTKGKLIDKKKITTSSYEIKSIDNKEYLFLEWKMGNYVYGGAKPAYYVFERFKK